MDTLASLILKLDNVEVEVTVTYVSEYNIRIVAKDFCNYRRWTGNIGKGFFDQFATKLTPQIAWKIALTGFQTQKEDYRFDIFHPENMKLDEQNITKYKNYVILLLKYDGMIQCNMPFPLVNTPFTADELVGFLKTMKAEKTAAETQKTEYFLMQKQIKEMNETFNRQKRSMEDQIEDMQNEIEQLNKTINKKDETIRKLKESKNDTIYSTRRRQSSPARNVAAAKPQKTKRMSSPYRSMSLLERQALLDAKHPPRKTSANKRTSPAQKRRPYTARSATTSRSSSVVNSRKSSVQSSAATSAASSRRNSATNSRRNSAYGSRAASPSLSRRSSGLSSGRNSRSSTPTNSKTYLRGKSPAYHRFDPTAWVKNNQKKRTPSPKTFRKY